MKQFSKFTLAFLLIVAPFLSGGLSSCSSDGGTDPIMKTTRLNEDAVPSRKDGKQDKQKLKVESFRTNFAIDI